MNNIHKYLDSSIGRKQIVAATGLLLILYVIVHLAGNLFIYAGPAAFNGYAHKLHSLRPFLYVIEFGLLAVFVIHIWVTYLLVLENIQARGQGYAVYKSTGERSLAARLMPYTGTFLLIFVVWHLLDFTFVDREGPLSFIGGKSLGLYGVVYNAFLNPLHSVLYILAMMCLGFHLSHGIQSFCQTYGIGDDDFRLAMGKVSNFLGFTVVFGYSTIPAVIYFGLIHP